MTDDSTERSQRDPDLREQVETALRFLEWSHGDALRRPWSDEAKAYYEAIDILEAALDDELRAPDESRYSDRGRKLIKESREAREAGYREATLLGEGDAPDPSRSGMTPQELAHSLLRRVVEYVR